MNAEELERLRTSILLMLDASDPSALTLDALQVGAKLKGFRLEPRDIERECAFLADPKVRTEGELIRPDSSGLSRGIKRYTITAQGREWLASAGF